MITVSILFLFIFKTHNQCFSDDISYATIVLDGANWKMILKTQDSVGKLKPQAREKV